MVNPEQALVLMLKGLRIFYLVIRVLYHQLKELQNLMIVNLEVFVVELIFLYTNQTGSFFNICFYETNS